MNKVTEEEQKKLIEFDNYQKQKMKKEKKIRGVKTSRYISFYL